MTEDFIFVASQFIVVVKKMLKQYVLQYLLLTELQTMTLTLWTHHFVVNFQTLPNMLKLDDMYGLYRKQYVRVL